MRSRIYYNFTKDGFSYSRSIIISATLSAFTGAYIGSKALKKITMAAVQTIVSVGLFLLAVAIGMGII